MQKSKLKHEDKSSNRIIAFLQEVREDFRNLRVPLLLMILIAFAWGQEEQRLDLARSTPVNYPMVAAINNGQLYLILYFLFALITLGILFVKARRILIIVAPVILYGFLLAMLLSRTQANMITTDAITLNNHRYYVSRFDSWMRIVYGRQFSADVQETHFIIVYKCNEDGVLCDAVFEDANTELSIHRPILEFEIDDKQLLIRRTGNDYDGRKKRSTDFIAVIEDDLVDE